MTPKPPPAVLERVEEALRNLKGTRNEQEEQEAVSRAVSVPLVAAKWLIAHVRGEEKVVADPQYIPGGKGGC